MGWCPTRLVRDSLAIAFPARERGWGKGGGNHPVNAGAKTGQATEQNQATCGARMRPPGGRSPSGGLMRAWRLFKRVSAGLSGAALDETIAVAVHIENVDVMVMRSSSAPVRRLDTMVSVHSSNGRLLVIRVAARS